MNIYIVPRQFHNWNMETYGSFFARDDHPYQYNVTDTKTMFATNIAQWEKFSINFFQYREQLSRITMDRWPFQCLSVDEALKLNDPDIILIPLDDDDIINPCVIAALEELYTHNIDGISWDTWVYSIVNHRPQLMRESEFEHKIGEKHLACLTSSNCYSMRSNLATRDNLLHHHKYAYDMSFNKLYMNRPWGLRFMHPGGTWLMQTMETTNLDNIYTIMPDIPDDLRWGRDFITEVSHLTWQSMGIFSKNT